MASLQTPISPKLSFSDTQPISHCHRIWDTEAARFTPCALPYVSTIPAILAALVLLRYSLQVTSTYWPRWMKPFVQETREKIDEFEVAPTRRPWTATIGLLVVASIGLTFQITHVFLPLHQPMAIYPAIAWAVVIAILLIERPRTASLSLLILFTGLLLEQLIMLSHKQTSFVTSDLPWIVAPLTSFLAIVTVLNMPFRDPMLPSKDISPVYGVPTVQQRTPEDNLTPWQYMTVSWMEPLMKIGKTHQMEDGDTWDLGWEFKHARLHDAFRTLRGSVTRKIFVANGMDLLRTTFLDLARLCATLLTPVFLQRVLASMELHNNRATVTYACIILALRLISAQLSVFNLWYQRRAYERCRGELITMLYEKTLHRKILGAKQDEKKEEDANDNTGELQEEAEEETGAENGSSKLPAKKWKQTLLDAIRPSPKKNAKKDEKKENDPASMGKILNLMRSDAYEIAQRFWEFSDIFIKPAGAIFAIILIWRMLGWACLLGVLALGASQLLNIVIARLQVHFEKKRRVATDEKIQRTSQFIESIRHLRWYGWQDAWLEGILESREKELHLRIANIVFVTSLAFILRFGSGLFPAVAFYAFTKMVGRDLSIDLIFPAIDLFNQLESYLRVLPQLVTTLLNAYVAMGRIEEFMAEPDKEETGLVPEGSADLSLHQASFAWPGVKQNVLSEITLAFPPGLTVVYGEVAAGKTALLQALLGELDTTAGELVRPDQMIAYCAQTPWLQSMSIRDNILFSSPYDAGRYKQTLEACALLPDMAEFKNGDLSNIGENGIGLSGGQKARVALARAVYSNAKVLLLDDPLSALDHQTAEFIVAKLLAGPLLQGRTTILVTHRTELCHGIAKQWVRLEHGRATIHEPTQDEDADALNRTHTNEGESEEEAKKREEEQSAAVPDKFIEDEHRAKGGVKWSVYWRYVKAGTLRWWSIAIFVMAAFRVLDVAQVWFVKSWGESYDDADHHGLFDFLPPATENVDPWLWTFFLFVSGTAILFWWTTLIMYGVGYHAAKTIFRETVQRVAHATFRFYDVTPVGRLMNRLTSDMNTIDGDLSGAFISFAWQLIGWVSCIVIILSSTPAFLAFGLLLCCGFVYYFFRFLPTSQSLRRLEMVSLSPLMSNFGALVEGLTTVRAFKAQRRFQARVIKVVDNFQKNDHFYWSLQAWLALRFSVMSSSSTFVMTLIAVYTGISPGLTAFVLITAGKFVLHTEWMCRIYGNLEMDFTSVERVVELLDVEIEAPGVVEPPAHWPTYSGDIEFDDVTIRYAENLDPALRNITLKIPAGSNTAVIGRTGSGKSTLALSLLATIAAENGRILIDGIDISTVKKQALRSRVTFLAQEPVLFPGTMRKNLDPLSEYSDASCLSVLEKIGGEQYSWSLTTNIEGGGKGLSQGQRQLVGLARAMLRRSPILIMDEATASIDFETAQRIQSVLREEMKSSTVITIAHRLEAVKAADYCVVLGNGKLVKAGKADDMLGEGSEFQAMLA